MPVPLVPAAPYPRLVRARLAKGWAPEAATVLPFLPRARLTPDEAELVRSSPERPDVLALRLGISERHIRRIRSGQAWKGAA